MNSPRPPTTTITPNGVSTQAASALPVNVARAQYKILRIYLKGASTEVPDMASVPRQAISPHVGIDMQTLANPAGPGALECVLRIALHARLEGKTIFLVEVSVAGVFELDISNMEDAQRFVRKIAPSVLFPFARRDLASLTVAAGFQPVLLDHIDFDAMLAQVITSQRLTRQPTPMPMRLDVIAAKPATLAASAAPVRVAQAVPPAVAAFPGWPDTQPPLGPDPELQALSKPGSAWLTAATSPSPPHPVALADAASTRPVMRPVTRPAPKRRATQTALALLGVATLAATLAWWSGREPAALVASAAPVAEGATTMRAVGPVSIPASSATLIVPAAALPEKMAAKASAEAERAMQVSRARLADQPAAWFTLDMGSAPLDAPLATLFPAVPLPDRPVFIVAGKDASMRLLYGVFPSKAAAERVQSQLQQSAVMQGRQVVTVAPIGSFL